MNVAYSNWAMWIVFSYIWLPFMILPIWAAIERIPDSYLEASADLGAHGFTTLRRVLLPLALPGIVAGSIFTFSLTLGDFITPTLVGGAGSDFIGNVVYRSVGIANNVPFAAAYATVPLDRHGRLPVVRAADGGVRGAVTERRSTRIALGVFTALVMLFLFFPLILIVVYAFNSSNVQSWPIPGLSTKWFTDRVPRRRHARRALAVGQGRAARTAIALRARVAGRVRGARASASSGARRSRSCSSCRSRCRGSSPAWR